MHNDQKFEEPGALSLRDAVRRDGGFSVVIALASFDFGKARRAVREASRGFPKPGSAGENFEETAKSHAQSIGDHLMSLVEAHMQLPWKTAQRSAQKRLEKSGWGLDELSLAWKNEHLGEAIARALLQGEPLERRLGIDVVLGLGRKSGSNIQDKLLQCSMAMRAGEQAIDPILKMLGQAGIGEASAAEIFALTQAARLEESKAISAGENRKIRKKL